MPKSTADRITLLNKVTLDSLGERSRLSIVKKFALASIQILGADFGFAWLRNSVDHNYELIYRSSNTPYDPNPPRKRGGNYKARKSSSVVFVPNTSKEKYSKQFDVRPYMESYAIIPVVYTGNFYGSIVVCYKKQRKFTGEDKSLATALGNALAQTLTISGLYNNLSSVQKTLDNALDSIFIFDPTSLKMRYANHGAVMFSGQKSVQLLNRTLDQIITGLSKAELLQKMNQTENQQYVMFESTFSHPTKGTIPVEVHLQHVVQEDTPAQFLAIVRDIAERKQSEQSITRMAYHDQLTGMPNRAFLTERLVEEHDQALKSKGQYTLFFMDLDRFKIINDIYGHQAGDSLLQQVSQRIRKVLPKKATLARMGGDEFIVLLPDVKSLEESEKCASLILSTFGTFFKISNQEIYSNGSLGFATFPLNGNSHHIVMKHADSALQRAKEHGGGNFQQYSQSHPLFYKMEPKLQSQLRHALKRDELVLHYQPIVSVSDKKIIGLEALVRWNHPEKGLLYPNDFVLQAEESGLIIEIGEWVINEVCRQITEWGESKIPCPPISINISPRELLRPTLVDRISATLLKHKVSSSQIKLELTETFLMKNIDLSINILKQLKALGVKILIDDFGTGYASLTYLKKLPIDAIKIDRSFIAGTPANLQDRALTSAIIAIAHQLNLEVIAEGVEKSSQLDFLRSYKCDFAQGMFFYKPQTASETSDLLKKPKTKKRKK